MRGKQLEIQAREAHFLSVGREILLSEGYPGVSISRVAEATRFSKGTVYQRFGSKEELVAAIGMQCRAKFLEVVRAASAFVGRPRERMVALGEAIVYYTRHHADDQRILKIIDSETILRTAPQSQQDQMKAYDIEIFLITLGVIQEAVDKGDLVLPDDLAARGLCFTFWVMVDGCFSATMGGAPLDEVGLGEPTAIVMRNAHYLMDGYGWRPLYNEWDYEETARKVRELLQKDADNGSVGSVSSTVG